MNILHNTFDQSAKLGKENCIWWSCIQTMNDVMTWWTLVSVLGGVVFGWYNETPAFPRPAEYRLHDINKLLVVLNGPVDLVVVTSAQIYHDVLVAVEEHARARVVQLVHLVEVWHLADIHKEYRSKVLYLFCYSI